MQNFIIGGLFVLANLHFNHHNAMGVANHLPAPQENRIIKKFSPHPYFDFDVPRNITTRVGQTAFINCRVEQMGDKSVSWIRKRDLHILSAGTAVYTSDERFQVIRSDKAENWTLQIKFAQQRDSGIYECQVNTEPKMSMAFRLNVVEAKAIILGPTDLYVKMGSVVTLTCIISQGPHDLGTIYWYRGSNLVQPIELQPNDPSLAYPHRISVELKWTEALTSRLKILDAKLADSGNYTCLPTSAEGTSVMVHVINEPHTQKSRAWKATSVRRQWKASKLLKRASGGDATWLRYDREQRSTPVCAAANDDDADSGAANARVASNRSRQLSDGSTSSDGVFKAALHTFHTHQRYHADSNGTAKGDNGSSHHHHRWHIIIFLLFVMRARRSRARHNRGKGVLQIL